MIGSLIWHAEIVKREAAECLNYLKDCKEEAEE